MDPWAEVHETATRKLSMMKMMTTSAVAGALLLGLATTAFATKGEVSYRHAEARASRVAEDPAPRKVVRMGCSIDGTYHDWLYCFGSNSVETTTTY
jgi:hypothetical protein